MPGTCCLTCPLAVTLTLQHTDNKNTIVISTPEHMATGTSADSTCPAVYIYVGSAGYSGFLGVFILHVIDMEHRTSPFVLQMRGSKTKKFSKLLQTSWHIRSLPRGSTYRSQRSQLNMTEVAREARPSVALMLEHPEASNDLRSNLQPNLCSSEYPPAVCRVFSHDLRQRPSVVLLSLATAATTYKQSLPSLLVLLVVAFFPYFHHDSTMSTEAPKENTRLFQPLDAAAPATEGAQNLLLNLEEFFHIGHGMG